MGKRQQAELRRLEKALLETDTQNALPDFGRNEPKINAHTIYNTDETDVDLEEYSDEVQKEPTGGAASVIVTMLVMILLSAGIFLLLKVLGVL